MIDHDVTCAEKMRLGEEIANDQTYHSMERQGRARLGLAWRAGI